MNARIRVNGREEDLAAPTVAALLAGRGIAAGTRGVAVALNGAVLPSRRWDETPLSAGDALEIIRPVQGG
ncbi:sulfur carrier protein ThiS (plasmid) [Azospirillum argentinense]|uniref:Sulfur carrier protein ThiS n=1 Tax=Azospirillum argentinense TaxID=2970906 RepID=A0A4D8PQM3_9PROT|nr:sulfur carrier protein ThiS [Azospirillum argentinense]QCN98987.1 sulfur carrier protein ThiS [Azospirillum argentinense]